MLWVSQSVLVVKIVAKQRKRLRFQIMPISMMMMIIIVMITYNNIINISMLLVVG